MDRKIKILHYDTNMDTDLVESTISRESMNCELKRINSSVDYINALKTDVFDVIISENSEDVNSSFRIAKEISPHSAFLVINSDKQGNMLTDGYNTKIYDGIKTTDLKILAKTIDKIMEEVVQKQDISCHWG